MGKRRQTRIKSVLPVRVWGVDSQGKPFAEVAHTLDISYAGVRLGGISTAVDIGSVVALQCRHRKGQFSVSWLGRPGSSRDKQIGLRNMEPSRDLFGMNLTDAYLVDDFVGNLEMEESNRKDRETRRTPRYNCSGGADFASPNSRNTNWAELQDISKFGCYLTTLSPLPVGTEIELAVHLEDDRIQVVGLVRTCHPMVGMGVEFQRFFTDDEESKLDAKLKKLREGASFPAPRGITIKPDAAAISMRLQGVTKELESIDQLIQNGPVDPTVLAEFRDAVSQVRNTAWALQRWMELDQSQLSPYPVLSYLNAERISMATRLCESLNNEFQKSDIGRQKKKLEGLLGAVEKLFTKLAGIDLAVLGPELEPEPVDVTMKPPESGPVPMEVSEKKSDGKDGGKGGGPSDPEVTAEW